MNNINTLQFFTIVILLFSTYSSSAQIHINEWMAKNETTITDPEGDYDDWIEIYNSSDVDIDLAGYYISDLPSEPSLWQIPEGAPALTTVPAGGFLLLWADKDIEDGANHVNFKLSASGDSIAIFKEENGSLVNIDFVSFNEQTEDISSGRLVDGQADIDVLSFPSPAATNAEPVLPSTYSSFVTSQIANSNDDVEETSYGGMIMDSYHLEMADDWSNQITGLRFIDLNIPQGARILSAHIQFSVSEPSAEECNLSIECDNSDSAAPFTDADENVSSRTRTNNQIAWQLEPWTAEFVSDTAQTTPDLSSIVEEVVNRPGWQIGNDMAFIISGTGTRQAVSYDYAGHSNRAAKLYISYESAVNQSPVSGIRINEIAANGSDYLNASNDYSDWIELYNESEQTQDIQGLFLSDEPQNLLKWAINKPVNIAAGDFVMINADDETEKEEGLHANFKLGKNGETITLSQVIDNQIIILDSITYPAIPFKATYGREFDGSDNWVMFGNTTPTTSNDYGIEYLEPASISPASGLFENEVTDITLTHSDPSAILYYTTDGSIPNENSLVYSAPFNVNSNAVVRVKAFKENYANNVVPMETYLINAEHELPIITISTAPENLFDDETGIYVVGTNGTDPGYCGDIGPANFFNDWERPASVALYEPDGQKAFDVNAGIRVSGSCSRKQALKSMNVYLRANQYGDKEIEYQIFPNRDRDKFKRLKIRSSGQDFRVSMMRDGTIHQMTGEILDMDYQAYRPAVVYMNGEYWGIMNMRELYGGNYFEDHFDVDKEEMDLIKNPRLQNEIKEGYDTEYNFVFGFVENNDLSIQANYDFIAERIDIDNFMNYWITSVYLSCSDWPANNLMVWRKQDNGKFRWVLIDTDASTSAYGTQGNTSYSYDMLDKVTRADAIGWPNDAKSTLLFRKLLENEEFREEYIQRSCSVMDIIYSSERTAEFINNSAAKIDSEIADHINRWAFDLPYLQDYSKWQIRIERFKEFFELRPDYWVNILDDHFELEETFELTFNYNEDTPGTLFVNQNDIQVPYNHTNTYFTQIPVKVSVVANDGYEFLYWLETGETNPEIYFSSDTDAVLTPVFEEIAIYAQVTGPTGLCLGTSTEVNIDVQNCPSCIGLWSDGYIGNTRTLSPTESTAYTISISNEAGTFTQELEYNLEVYPLPSVDANISNSSCFAADNAAITLTASTGNTPFSYQWSTGSNESQVNELAPGDYSVTFTDTQNCTQTQSFTVTQPQDLQIEFMTENVTCFAANNGSTEALVAGGTAPYNFVWAHTNDDSSLQENLAPGNYTVTITDANDCDAAFETSIDEPTEITLNISQSDTICHASTTGFINVEATGGAGDFDFSWNNQSYDSSIENLASGIYFLTVTDGTDCSITDSFEVLEYPEIEINEEIVNNDCYGNTTASININPSNEGFAPFNFLWNTGDTSAEITNLAAGDYTVTITDALGCTTEAMYSVSTPDALIIEADIQNPDAEPTGSIELNLLGGTAPFTFMWSNEETTQNITGLAAGNYSVTITDANGCQSEETFVLNTSSSELVTLISSFEIFPNPNDGHFNLRLAFERSISGKIEISNSIGQIIFSENISGNRLEKALKLTHLPTGVYFIQVYFENDFISKKIIIE